MTTTTNHSGIYNYDGTESTDSKYTAWIICPHIDTDGLALIDMQTVPNDVLDALWDEAASAGDEAMIEILRVVMQ